MPNQHGQVTEEDFTAPTGMYRIVKEDMEDGELSVQLDTTSFKLAIAVLPMYQREDPENIFTLCSADGPINGPNLTQSIDAFGGAIRIVGKLRL